MKKVCVITGSRAEYGLLYWTMRGIQSSKELQLQLVVTGMHLSPEFGLTYQQIEQDGFQINHKVDMLLASNSEIGITKSMGVGMLGFSDALAELSPDMLVVLGDRFEIFSAVSAAMIARIPVAHIHGGELSEGAFDESIRHSITKMSHLHFTAAESYWRRVVQLGEQPSRVYNVGAVGVDNVMHLELLKRDELEQTINFSLGCKCILVTFHPTTLEYSTAENQFQNLLNVLDEYSDLRVIFTKPNADTNSRVISRMIDQYVSSRPETTTSFIHMGQLNYLSTLQLVDGVVGNSSSGILEAPSLKTATINIGDRQRGRLRAKSVIDCEPTSAGIRLAMQRLFSVEFLQQVEGVVSPYGTGGAAQKIVTILENAQLDGILKKSFYDISEESVRYKDAEY